MSEVLRRFWAKVSPEPNNGCWLWDAGCNPDGYGNFVMRGAGTRLAHRLSYMMFVGSIPKGFELDHKCRIRSCVNPNHLRIVTHKDNCKFGVGSKTHCKHGHEYTPENTFLGKSPSGTKERECRICISLRKKLKRRLRKSQKEAIA